MIISPKIYIALGLAVAIILGGFAIKEYGKQQYNEGQKYQVTVDKNAAQKAADDASAALAAKELEAETYETDYQKQSQRLADLAKTQTQLENKYKVLYEKDKNGIIVAAPTVYLSLGAVCLWNAALGNDDKVPNISFCAEQSDGSSSGSSTVDWDTAFNNALINLRGYQKVRIQLIDLQNWVKKISSPQ